MQNGLGGSLGMPYYCVSLSDYLLLLIYFGFICFSSIWAPQPRAYNLSDKSDHSSAGAIQSEPISEGDEADEEFFSGSKAPLLTKIRE